MALLALLLQLASIGGAAVSGHDVAQSAGASCFKLAPVSADGGAPVAPDNADHRQCCMLHCSASILPVLDEFAFKTVPFDFPEVRRRDRDRRDALRPAPEISLQSQRPPPRQS